MTPQRGGGSDGNDWEGYITADQPKVIVITISYADSGRPWEAMTTCVVIASWAVCVSTLTRGSGHRPKGARGAGVALADDQARGVRRPVVASRVRLARRVDQRGRGIRPSPAGTWPRRPPRSHRPHTRDPAVH